MPRTYEPIASTTVTGSSTSGIIFSNISGNYTDLVLVIQARSQRSADQAEIYGYINNDSGTNYSRTRIWSNTGSAFSDRNTSQGIFIIGEVPAANATSGVFGTTIAHFNNYSNTTTNKTILSRNGHALSYPVGNFYCNLWRSTAAITALDIYNTDAANWSIGSTFTLYGIKAA